MTMKRENNQELVQEPSEARSLGSSSLATRTQPWRFWSQCNLLGGSILITKEFTRFTEDFFHTTQECDDFVGGAARRIPVIKSIRRTPWNAALTL